MWAYGGIPRVMYELSRELTRMRHDVTVYTTDVLDQDKRCDQSGRETKVDGITVRYFRNISNSLAYPDRRPHRTSIILDMRVNMCEFIQA